MGEFIYQRSVAPCGVAVEEIYGAEEKSAKVWKLFAMQIFSESAGDYRSIVHLDNGAPLLEDVPQRISVSHTPHYLVVASIPKTPDINLEEFNIRTAIGIDIEKADRSQVLKVRDKFLSEDEQKLLPPVSDTTTDDHQPTTDNRQPTTDNRQPTTSHILAWTCKEALYKAALGAVPDFKEDYRIISLPEIAKDIKSATPDKYGKATIRFDNENIIDMNLSSWESDGHVITISFSQKIPIYK